MILQVGETGVVIIVNLLRCWGEIDDMILSALRNLLFLILRIAMDLEKLIITRVSHLENASMSYWDEQAYPKLPRNYMLDLF